MKALLRGCLALWLVTSAGCSLIVDVSDIDEGCGPDRKICGGVCVEQSDPAYGCGATGCTPCLMPNAIPKCEAGRCAIAACLYGFGCDDCHANLLSDDMNCGGCGEKCAAGMSCQDRVCVADHPP